MKEIKIFNVKFEELITAHLDKYDCIQNTGVKPHELLELCKIFLYKLNCLDEDLASLIIQENDTLLRLQNDVIISIKYNTYQSILIDVLLAFPNKFGLKELD